MLGLLMSIFTGTLVGVAVDGTVGGMVGFSAGGILGILWLTVWYTRIQKPNTKGVFSDRAELDMVCIHRGRECRVELTGDPTAERWVGVEQCSIQEGNPPQCAQTCLTMMNDTDFRPRLRPEEQAV